MLNGDSEGNVIHIKYMVIHVTVKLFVRDVTNINVTSFEFVMQESDREINSSNQKMLFF